jgi:alpha-N-arabinofuranosidase
MVDAAAVLREDGEVVIFAVNRDLKEDVLLDADLRSFGDMQVKSHSVLHHDDVKAINTEENPNEVTPVEVGANKEGILLPAASWNVIRLGK